MMETMIVSMVPATRSRRTDVLRAPPLLLPKQKQQALEQQHHPQRFGAQNPQQHPLQPLQHLTRPMPPPLQQQNTALHSSRSHPQQQPLQPQPAAAAAAAPASPQSPSPFSISSQTRSIQNILNHANSMRPKRKSDASKEDSDDPLNGPGDGFSAAQLQRKRQRLAVVEGAMTTSPAKPPPPPASASAARPGTTATPVNAPPKKALRGTAAAPGPTPASSAVSAVQQAQPPLSLLLSQRGSTTTTKPPSRSVGRPPTNKPAERGALKQDLKRLQLTPNAATIASSSSTAASAASAATTVEGGRKLRSQEASRFKSELSAYFPDYDEVIGNDPKEEYLLNIDTPILLTESSAASAAADANTAPSPTTGSGSIRSYGDALFYDLFDSHQIDFGFLAGQKRARGVTDPLPDSCFEPSHKRAERTERSIRNSEKGRAQHEKDQIVRLLEGLQGPDWLRIMGVSGITESKKKSFEPAREHFIQGCKAILKKFKLWGQEEKRRKLEKDRAHADELRARDAGTASVRRRGRKKASATLPAAALTTAAAEQPKPKAARGRKKSAEAVAAAVEKKPKRARTTGARSKLGTRARARAASSSDADEAMDDISMAEGSAQGDSDGQGEEQVSGHSDGEGDDEHGDNDSDESSDDNDDDSQPDSSDVDAVIAKQLRAEALARSRLSVKGAGSKGDRKKQAPLPSQSQSEPQLVAQPQPKADGTSKAPKRQLDITSFFEKPYQREAALSRSRRKGRNIMAWGLPVPEPAVLDFDLPREIKEDEVVKVHTRRTRSDKRVGEEA